ncbi:MULTISPECIES: TonB-dependent receptor [unclassified Sphingomonas]|uniref:TonB-dependent receptor n=1 Tax=unclassified Sphingomonas TaxID=196159 RepID=UPI000AEA594A|nr:MULTISPECIES: TonB-dependent receptor [unclassified Sphingomonas]MBN8849328.1 TonB-dependent receptor [Sphingomonas sp.]
MSNKSKSFLALSCVGFIASAPAGAAALPGNADAPEADGDAVRHSDVVVTGERERRDANPKFIAPPVDTPRSIVVLPAETIEQTGSATLADALRTVPGITFGAAEGGNPIGDRPFIRGFDSQGSTYVDGVRDFASQSREVFAVDSIQIIRGSDTTLGGRGNAGGTINIISKTPQKESFARATASYGTADYKRFTADVNQRVSDMIAVRVEGMFHDQDVAGRDAIWQRRWGVAPSITIGVDSPTRLTIGYYHMHSNELPDSGIPYLYTIGNVPRTGYVLSEPAIGHVTTANGQSGYVDRSTFYGLKDRDFRDTDIDQATIRAEHDFGGITLRNTSRFTHNWQAYIFLLPDDSQGNVYNTGQVWRRANTRYGYADSIVNQTDLFGKFDTGGIKHSFAIGAELAWEKARRGAFVTRGFVNSSGNELLSTGGTISPRCNATTVSRYYCTSIFNPNPNDPWVNYASDTSTTPAAISRNLPIAETQNDANTLGIYGFDSITLAEPLILNLGLRYDRFHSRVRPGQPITATSMIQFERTDELFNWQAGLVFKPTHNTSLYASYATAATPPNSLLGEGSEGNALPTTVATANVLDALKPEKTKSYEVGAKADLLGGRLSLSAAAFQTDTDNARVTGDDNTVQFIGKRRIRGVELSVNGTILPGWTIFGGYTHLDPKIVDGGFSSLTVAANGPAKATTVLVPSVNNGKQAPQTAKDSVSLWTNVTLFEKLQIGGGVFYFSRVYGGYADNRSASQDTSGNITVKPATTVLARSVPGYTRFDARLGYDITERVNLSVNVQNLTDKTYFTQAYASHYATIAPGRSAFATLSVRY